MDRYTITEVVQRSGCCPATVYKYVVTGKLPAVKMGNTWCIEAEAADRFIAERRARKAVTPGAQ